MTDLSDYIRVVHDPLERKLRGRIADLEARHAQTVEALAWWTDEYDLRDEATLLVLSLGTPDRDVWFSRILPDLDYELKGGTWNEPLWAWQKHPWMKTLGLTNDECEAALAADTDSQQETTT